MKKHPYAVAQFLEEVPKELTAEFMQSVSSSKRVKLFSVMDTKKAAELLPILPAKLVKELVENSESIIVASVLKQLDQGARDAIMGTLGEDSRDSIVQQLSFLPNTVAAKMRKTMVVGQSITVRDVIALLRDYDHRELVFVYVVDAEGIFQGVVRLKDVIRAAEDDLLERLPLENPPAFLSDTPLKSLVNHPVWMEFTEVPIVNSVGNILGSLPYQKVFKASEKNRKNPNVEIVETGSALGELYRIGLAGLLQSGGK